MQGVLSRVVFVVAASACIALIPAAATRADAPSNCAGADLSPTAADMPQVQSATLCLLNAERTSRGLVALRTNARLARAALQHSADMVSNHYFAHEDKSGHGPDYRIQRAGYMPKYGPWVIGENIAWGTDYLATPREIMRAWMNSPPHRHNILYSDFREIGIGIVVGVPDPSFGTDGATYSTEFGSKARELTQARRAHRASHHRRHRPSSSRGCKPTPNPAVSFCS